MLTYTTYQNINIVNNDSDFAINNYTPASYFYVEQMAVNNNVDIQITNLNDDGSLERLSGTPLYIQHASVNKKWIFANVRLKKVPSALAFLDATRLILKNLYAPVQFQHLELPRDWQISAQGYCMDGQTEFNRHGDAIYIFWESSSTWYGGDGYVEISDNSEIFECGKRDYVVQAVEIKSFMPQLDLSPNVRIVDSKITCDESGCKRIIYIHGEYGTTYSKWLNKISLLNIILANYTTLTNQSVRYDQIRMEFVKEATIDGVVYAGAGGWGLLGIKDIYDTVSASGLDAHQCQTGENYLTECLQNQPYWGASYQQNYWTYSPPNVIPIYVFDSTIWAQTDANLYYDGAACPSQGTEWDWGKNKNGVTIVNSYPGGFNWNSGCVGVTITE